MSDWTLKFNAVLAGVVIAFGFTMAWTPIPVAYAVVAGLGFTALLVWLGTTPKHIWAWACLFLGLESLSWPAVQMIKLKMSGVAEPSEDQMIELFRAGVFGVIFATFWLTFAYGVFRWIKRGETPEEPPPK
ncbi:MAG TPA: hypothetical protein VE201_05990 [Nitrospirales bacterium]|jgi:hypothetical protein|nr:hypothetical protein [Nitrospirales bacterium]